MTRLDGRWVDLARDGDTRGDYARPTAAAMAFMAAAVNAGLTFADVDALLLGGQLYDAAYLTKSDGRRRQVRSAATLARRDYDKAVRYVADRPSVIDAAEALQTLGMLRTAIATADWPGRSGPRDKAVLEALVAIGESLGTVRPAVSLRTLCEDTPYRSAVTVKNALDSLAASGWVTRERGDTIDQPTVYTLTERGSQREQHMLYPRVGGDVQVTTPPSTPLALVLGVHAATVHATLTDLPVSRNDLHRLTGFAKSTCGKWLAQLARLGLARQTPAGWVRTTLAPEQVAFEHGADLIALNRATAHALQRAGWAEHLGRGPVLVPVPCIGPDTQPDTQPDTHPATSRAVA